MSEHPLCCDCERCLNGAGGFTLAAAGRVKTNAQVQSEKVRWWGGSGGSASVTEVGRRLERQENLKNLRRARLYRAQRRATV